MVVLASLGLALAAPAYGNTPPLIADVPDQVIAQNTSTATNVFTVGDAETAFGALTVTATSSNPTLVPQAPANLALGGSLSQRTIRITPAPDQTGTALITLRVSDGTATASSTFTVTVTPPNTPPTLSGLPEYQLAAPGQVPAALPFIVGDAETAADSLGVAVSSSKTSLVPNANVTLGGAGANRTVRITPVPGQRSGDRAATMGCDHAGAISSVTRGARIASRKPHAPTRSPAPRGRECDSAWAQKRHPRAG